MDRVFQFATIDLCPTIEEYSRILGMPYNTVLCFLHYSIRFRSGRPQNFGDQKEHLGKKAVKLKNVLWACSAIYRQTKCIWKQSSNLWLLVSRWSHKRVLAFELAVLSHVMFSRDLEGVNTGLVVFQEQIEKGYTFLSILIVDTFRALGIATTFRLSYSECCVLLFQVWFLEHLIACRSLITKGLFKQDLIRTHLKNDVFKPF